MHRGVKTERNECVKSCEIVHDDSAIVYESYSIVLVLDLIIKEGQEKGVKQI